FLRVICWIPVGTAAVGASLLAIRVASSAVQFLLAASVDGGTSALIALVSLTCTVVLLYRYTDPNGRKETGGFLLVTVAGAFLSIPVSLILRSAFDPLRVMAFVVLGSQTLFCAVASWRSEGAPGAFAVAVLGAVLVGLTLGLGERNGDPRLELPVALVL